MKIDGERTSLDVASERIYKGSKSEILQTSNGAPVAGGFERWQHVENDPVRTRNEAMKSYNESYHVKRDGRVAPTSYIVGAYLALCVRRTENGLKWYQ